MAVQFNKPVYDFLGYKLIKVNFNRLNDGLLEKFSISISNSDIDDNSKIYSFFINVTMYFKDNVESKFEFLTAFLINDMEWFNSLNSTFRDSMFFSVVFPFIRQKINELCDDSRESVKIPIVNLKNTNLCKEVVFILNK